MIDQFCVCGHVNYVHNVTQSIFGYENFCDRCGEDIFDSSEKYWNARRHDFKLDNLRLLEDTAKQKGLL